MDTSTVAARGGDPAEKIGSENFPVALRVLPRAHRRDLTAIYGYARMVDDLGDDAVTGAGRALPTTADRLAALDAVETELHGVYAGEPARRPELAALAGFIAEHGVPVDPLLRLIEANRVDQTVTRYATFDDLVGYCALSADPVGELVLYAFGAHTPERVALSDRICTALQVVEHLQDVPEDHRAGRIYLPAEDLDRFGVAEADLGADRATPALRELVAFEADRAGRWLSAGTPLLRTLHGYGRLAVTGYVAGGRAALRALAASRYDPLPGPPKATKAAILAAALRLAIRPGRPSRPGRTDHPRGADRTDPADPAGSADPAGRAGQPGRDA
jgi:squalene synthase HpnC